MTDQEISAKGPASAAREASIRILRDLRDVLVCDETEHHAEAMRSIDPRYLGAHERFAHTVRVVTCTTRLIVSGTGAYGAPIADGQDPFTFVGYPIDPTDDLDAFTTALRDPLRTAVTDMLARVTAAGQPR